MDTSKGTVAWMINGILTRPGSPKNWNRRGCFWFTKHTPYRALMDEYYTTPLTVWIRQKQRAKVFADALSSFEPGWRHIIIAHSNGAWVAVNALQMLRWYSVAELHLVSGACDGNMQRNRLNFALKSNMLGKLCVYIAGKDRAMRYEETLAGRCLFGIYPGDKPLGLAGATHLDWQIETDASRFRQHIEPTYGHGDWFLPQNFDKTFRRFIQA